MPAAARVSDNHTCPMANPNGNPHTGGPIMPAGVPTVLIGGQPAAVVGTQCVCAGPPDSITKGSSSVLIGGKQAARQGDMTAHGGTIAAGFPSVIIGG
ncbi:MAG TPA: PAAR domain-containing protein [Chitinophaga sp.]|uniref:PAAR domain-containing protein n=1 Tax=Chitinophaga sp. TaxID=1869181 RepID=UPI002DB9AD76|nr:PAAR domain-containing protein [Chitinophaga sp.]HEU4553922.1 PAAR domain-containing protein [Chitinophaga sp.]